MMPGSSVMKISLSALSAVAVLAATSSIDRLNACPVGEKPSGESSTILRLDSEYWIDSASILRTSPVCWKSTPLTIPTGRAVTKLPDTTEMRAPAIGVFGNPWLKAASISRRSSPEASLADSSAALSVTRTPSTNWVCTLRSASCSSTCGREPCTSTMRMPMACSRATSLTSAPRLPAWTSSPPKPITKVLSRKAWI